MVTAQESGQGGSGQVSRDQLAVDKCARREAAEDGEVGIARRVVGRLAAPEAPAGRINGGEGADAVPLRLETVVGRVERVSGLRQHRE
jgi:hypothetical protein